MFTIVDILNLRGLLCNLTVELRFRVFLNNRKTQGIFQCWKWKMKNDRNEYGSRDTPCTTKHSARVYLANCMVLMYIYIIFFMTESRINFNSLCTWVGSTCSYNKCAALYLYGLFRVKYYLHTHTHKHTSDGCKKFNVTKNGNYYFRFITKRMWR